MGKPSRGREDYELHSEYKIQVVVCWLLKERHGSVNKGNFESNQCVSKACSYILEDRESSLLFITME